MVVRCPSVQKDVSETVVIRLTGTQPNCAVALALVDVNAIRIAVIASVTQQLGAPPLDVLVFKTCGLVTAPSTGSRRLQETQPEITIVTIIQLSDATNADAVLLRRTRCYP